MRVFLTRHGESEYNTVGRLGGDTGLTDAGKNYAQLLRTYQDNHDDFPTTIITSTKRRTIETASFLGKPSEQRGELDEIYAGVAENMTYEEFADMYPEEHVLRKQDKLRYRYPSGESYIDLIERTRGVCEKIKGDNKDVLIVCHRAIARVLIHHLTGLELDEIPHVDVPLHTLMVIEDKKVSRVDIGDTC